jgi:hypothetical protein
MNFNELRKKVSELKKKGKLPDKYKNIKLTKLKKHDIENILNTGIKGERLKDLNKINKIKDYKKNNTIRFYDNIYNKRKIELKKYLEDIRENKDNLITINKYEYRGKEYEKKIIKNGKLELIIKNIQRLPETYLNNMNEQDKTELKQIINNIVNEYLKVGNLTYSYGNNTFTITDNSSKILKELLYNSITGDVIYENEILENRDSIQNTSYYNQQGGKIKINNSMVNAVFDVEGNYFKYTHNTILNLSEYGIYNKEQYKYNKSLENKIKQYNNIIYELKEENKDIILNNKINKDIKNTDSKSIYPDKVIKAIKRLEELKKQYKKYEEMTLTNCLYNSIEYIIKNKLIYDNNNNIIEYKINKQDMEKIKVLCSYNYKTNNIYQIADIMKCNIKMMYEYNNKSEIQKYPVKKDYGKYIEIGLYKNHYIPNVNIPIYKYVLKNYNDIINYSNTKKFNNDNDKYKFILTRNRKEKNKYYETKNKYKYGIKLFTCLKLMNDNKLLEEIDINDIEEKYKKIRDNKLKYDENNIINNKFYGKYKEDKKEFIPFDTITYADFEAIGLEEEDIKLIKNDYIIIPEIYINNIEFIKQQILKFFDMDKEDNIIYILNEMDINKLKLLIQQYNNNKLKKSIIKGRQYKAYSLGYIIDQYKKYRDITDDNKYTLFEYMIMDICKQEGNKHLVYFHNMKYDSSFFIIKNLPIKHINITMKDNIYYQYKFMYKNKTIFIRDSFKIYSDSLSKFAKAMDVDEIKTVYPYNFTSDNYDTHYTKNFNDYDKDKLNDIKKELGDDNYKIFISNIVKHQLINLKMYNKYYNMLDCECLKNCMDKFQNNVSQLYKDLNEYLSIYNHNKTYINNILNLLKYNNNTNTNTNNNNNTNTNTNTNNNNNNNNNNNYIFKSTKIDINNIKNLIYKSLGDNILINILNDNDIIYYIIQYIISKNEEIKITNYITYDKYRDMTISGISYNNISSVMNNCYMYNSDVKYFLKNFIVGGRTAGKNNIPGNYKVDNKLINHNIINTFCIKYNIDSKSINTNAIIDNDVNSLYPYALTNIKIPKCKLQSIPKYMLNKIVNINDTNIINKLSGKTNQYYYIKVKILDCNKDLNYDIGVYNKKDNNNVIQWVNNMDNEFYYMDTNTLKSLILMNKINKFKIMYGLYYKDTTDYIEEIPLIFNFIYNKRSDYKKSGNPIQLVYKLIMNSYYGKMCQSPSFTKTIILDYKRFNTYLSRNFNNIISYKITYNNNYEVTIYDKDRDYNFYSFGAMVLSESKFIVNQYLKLCYDLNIPVYYTDTDSIHHPKYAYNIMKSYYETILLKPFDYNVLGAFSSDFSGDTYSNNFIFIEKKHYFHKMSSGDDIYHCKGIQKKLFNKYDNKDIYNIYNDLYNFNLKYNNDHYNNPNNFIHFKDIEPQFKYLFDDVDISKQCLIIRYSNHNNCYKITQGVKSDLINNKDNLFIKHLIKTRTKYLTNKLALN